MIESIGDSQGEYLGLLSSLRWLHYLKCVLHSLLSDNLTLLGSMIASCFSHSSLPMSFNVTLSALEPTLLTRLNGCHQQQLQILKENSKAYFGTSKHSSC